MEGGMFKYHLWKYGTSTSINHFKMVMAKFKVVSDKAHDWLTKIPIVL